MIDVNVIGGKLPGRIQVLANTPLVQAVLAAGGLRIGVLMVGTWNG